MKKNLALSLIIIIIMVACQESKMKREGQIAVNAFIEEMNPELAKKMRKIEEEIILSNQKIKQLSELKLKHPNHVGKIEISLQKWALLQNKLVYALKEIRDIVESAYVAYELDRIQGGKEFNKMSNKLLSSANTVLHSANTTKTVIEQTIDELEPPPNLSQTVNKKSSNLPTQLYKELKGHNGDINAIAFSSNGRVLASGSNDNTVKLWDIQTAKEIKTLHASTEDILTVAFNANFLATAGSDQIIKLWDLKTTANPRSLKGHEGIIHSIAFSPNGERLISGSWDKTIRLWDINAATELHQFKGKDSIYSVAFHPNGQLIAAGSFDETITIWDCNTGKLVRTLRGNGMLTVYSVAFSPDGKQIISGDLSNAVRIWETNTGKSKLILKGKNDVFGGVFSVAYSPDGHFIASGSGDETLSLWHSKTGEKLETLRENNVRTVAFSPDGRLLASGHDDNTIKLWH